MIESIWGYLLTLFIMLTGFAILLIAETNLPLTIAIGGGLFLAIYQIVKRFH